MKRSIIKICVLTALAMAGGCSSFLDVHNPGKNDIPKFFSNVEGLRLASSGMYSLLYNFCDGYYTKYGDVAADMVQLVAGEDMKNQFEYISLPEQNGTAVSHIWLNGYELLANTNNIIAYAPGLRENFPQYAAEINRIYAEALFVRALAHLMLCNTYAQPYNFTANASHMGIPVVSRIIGSNEMVGRSTVAQVYGRITEDLDDALAILGEPVAPVKQTECYYATARACKALQARVYLYMGQHALARDCATTLIDLMALTPRNDYKQMMQLNEDSSPGQEAIFRLSGIGTNSHTLVKFYQNSDTGAPAVATQKLIDTFVEGGDIRRALIDEGNEITKYRHPILKQEDGETLPETREIPYGVHILRLSEMYLVRAEAYCELNELGLAEKDVKEIIGRSVGKTAAEITLSYSDKESLMAIIDRERALELLGEGHRLFDIVRRKQNMVRDPENTSIYAKTIEYPNDKFVLPIPFSETSVNTALDQNPGY